MSVSKLDSSCALILIDVQKGFDEPYWGVRNNPALEANISKLLAHFRAAGLTVVHVRHDSVEPRSPLRPGQIGNDFKEEVLPLPGEHLETKNVNSAFIGTGLEAYLRRNNLTTLILCGLTSDHCVSTTTRMAANLGFRVVLPEDCLATFNRTGVDGRNWSAQDIHDSSMASLNGEFAEVLQSDRLVELLQAFAGSQVG
ncbi:MAG: cysteine hydrolase [Cyanobacteria bacterium SZAS TMP-1]|nr:cysteine hydrolase [Cyanobacteria bacterium SZAS TMP-1]